MESSHTKNDPATTVCLVGDDRFYRELIEGWFKEADTYVPLPLRNVRPERKAIC